MRDMLPCSTTVLPAGGILSLYGDHGAGSNTILLQQAGLFQLPCAPAILPRQDDYDYSNTDTSLTQHDFADSPQYSNFHDPFASSTFPICYALAATTITAYMLVVMLFITPRSFLDGGIVTLNKRSFTNSSSGGISIGGRPWLQKVAALTVAISLTVASADTFKIAEEQYAWGAQNAKVLQNEVMGSTELKVVRLISDTFLWLAQAQTLIRLFPRQKEKIIIKWAAFALITLDVVFSAITSFRYSENGVNVTNPRNFVAPIPALSYLFQLTLGALYAAWVVYYSIMKKRYAFYHPLMKNICLVAIMSLCSIIIPIVFFVLDLVKPEFTGWGDYVRWVGAAAASVVVWEWVERIEALEREEKKDGILGRQVFDGDETLEVDAQDSSWSMKRKSFKDDSEKSASGGSAGSGGSGGARRGGGGGGGGGRQQGFHGWPGVSAIAGQHRGGHGPAGLDERDSARAPRESTTRPPIWPSRPPPAVTPISRSDTASAASTVYAVRYQAPSDSTRTPDPQIQQNLELSRQSSSPTSHPRSDGPASTNSSPVQGAPAPSGGAGASSSPNNQVAQPVPWRPAADLEGNRTTPAPSKPARRTAIQISSPLPRGISEQSAPSEALTQTHTQASTQEPRDWPRRVREGQGRWNIRGRFEEFAVNQADKLREKMRPTPDTQSLPVTVIPAPPRRGAALQQVLEEEELTAVMGSSQDTMMHRSQGSSSREASGQELALPSEANPPLWPGVEQRPIYYDDDDDEQDAYLYDDSSSDITDASSHVRERRGSHGEAAPPTRSAG